MSTESRRPAHFQGKAWCFADNVDTDVIIPARYLNTSDPRELARHLFADSRPRFAEAVVPGDFIVAGKNFGCGSSREHAPLALREAGLGAIIARSFARIFYRNAFNIGLPLIECAEAVEGVEEGDRLEADLEAGEIRNLDRGETFRSRAIPPFMQRLIAAGGLVNLVRRRLGASA